MKNKDTELENLELKIAKLLRSGVILAGLLILLGWMLHSNFRSDFNENPLLAFHEYQVLPLLQALQLDWLAGHWPILISYLGLFVLISLPVLRVLLTAVLFFRQGDKFLAAIATFVLVAILMSCLLGFEV